MMSVIGPIQSHYHDVVQ